MQVELLRLPLEIQTALGAGFLGYVAAYSGLRKNHTGQDKIFLTLSFGLISLLVFRMLAEVFGDGFAVAAAVFSTLVFAALWRKRGRGWWYALIRKAKVHMDDGQDSVWEHLIQRPELKVGQISVHTMDGRILYMNQREGYDDAISEGLRLGTDGSILMIVEEERLPDGTDQERKGIVDPAWGARLTYIPADQIQRVNIRCVSPTP